MRALQGEALSWGPRHRAGSRWKLAALALPPAGSAGLWKVHLARRSSVSSKQLPGERRGESSMQSWCRPHSPFLGAADPRGLPARCLGWAIRTQLCAHLRCSRSKKKKKISRLSIPHRCLRGAVPGQGDVRKVPSMWQKSRTLDSQGQIAFLFQFSSSFPKHILAEPFPGTRLLLGTASLP